MGQSPDDFSDSRVVRMVRQRTEPAFCLRDDFLPGRLRRSRAHSNDRL